MKRKINKGERLAGSIIGILLAFSMLVASINMVVTNNDFWMKQNDRYKLKDALSLVSNDGFRTLYYGYIDLFNGKDADVYAVKKGNPEDYSETFVASGFAPSEAMHWQFTADFDEKFFETVKELEKSKGNPEFNLDNKMCLEISCPEADKDFAGVSLGDIVISDKNGNPYTLRYEKLSVEKDGGVRRESFSPEGDFDFIPKSATTKIRAYITEAKDYSVINVSLKGEALGESGVIELLMTYTDVLTKEGVAEKTGPKEQLLTENEREQILNAAEFNKQLRLVAIMMVVIAVIIFVFAVRKFKKDGLFGIGMYVILSGLAFCVAVNILLMVIPANAVFSEFFSFAENTTSYIVMGEGFKNDISEGIVRFYDFLMIFPLLFGYVLTKIVKNKKDENEDYMYQ